MKTKEFLKKHDACTGGARWALSIGDDMVDVWEALIRHGKHNWLIWTATRPGVFPDSVLRKLACRFIRETPLADGRMVWDLLIDERSRKAVEVSEAYADGKATNEELEVAYDAAYDAGVRASAYAARDAAAFAAAYAADAAARDAADAAACAAAHAAYIAAFAADAADVAVRAAAYDVAEAAQMKMIAELGNPFKEERVK